MPTAYRIVDRAALRSELERSAFSSAPRLRDAFALEIEVFALRWNPSGDPPRPVGLLEPLDGVGHSGGLVQVAAALAHARGWQVCPPEEADVGPARSWERGSFAFGHGGQVGFRSAAAPTPREAFEECRRALDELGFALAPFGVSLVSIGAHPWSTLETLPLQDLSARARCLDLAQAARSDEAQRHLRLSAGTRVYVGFGGPVQALTRWEAARALAPIATAAFAFSPFDGGASSGLASLRGTRQRAASSKATYAPDVQTSPVDAYLDLALDSRVLVLRGWERWFPQTAELSFRDWTERGISGVFPDLEDWRFHLTTLQETVRPEGWLVVDAQDALPRPFWSVPLVLWAALLDDPAALAHARALDSGWLECREAAERSGLVDPTLGERARRLFALAADSLLRRPSGWASPEMLAAFVAFGQRFAFQRRSPADELLEVFADRRAFDREAYEGLERAWSEAAGTPERPPARLAAG